MAKMVQLPGGGIEFQHDDPEQERIRKESLRIMYEPATREAQRLFEQNPFIKSLRKAQNNGK